MCSLERQTEVNLKSGACLDVVARDLDWNGVYMTYVQLSMIGIKAVVIQGDTLAEPEKNYNAERFLMTPAKIGAIL